MSIEYRHSPRREVIQTVEVRDTVCEEVIGRLINLSETGLLLIAHQRLTSDALYQLRFRLPDPRGATHAIDVGAHELWSADAPAPGQFWIGLRFIDVSPAHRVFIKAWVEAPGGHFV